jgi:hypothetical protein
MIPGTFVGFPLSSIATNVKKAVAAIFLSPDIRFSAITFTKISIEDVPVDETNVSMQTESFGVIGLRKSTESIEAVTHSNLECLTAEIEAIISISLINFPPNKVLWLFTSLGKILLVLTTRDSLHVFASILNPSKNCLIYFTQITNFLVVFSENEAFVVHYLIYHCLSGGTQNEFASTDYEGIKY